MIIHVHSTKNTLMMIYSLTQYTGAYICNILYNIIRLIIYININIYTYVFCISTLSVSQRSTSSSASRSSASSFSSHHFYWCQPRANFVKTKCTNLTCYAMLTLPLNQCYAVHIFHISLFCQFVFLSSIFCFVVKRAVLGSWCSRSQLLRVVLAI